jgi:arylsulfatase A-like enzyme
VLLTLLLSGCGRAVERAAEASHGRAAAAPEEDVLDLMSYLPSAVFDSRPGRVELFTTVGRDEIRESIVVRPPSKIRFPAVPVHGGASFSVAYAATRPVGGSAPAATFVVRIETGGRVQEVVRAVVPVHSPSAGGWTEVEVPLPRGDGPGDAAAIELEVSGGDPLVYAGWSMLTIFSDGFVRAGAPPVTVREDDVADLIGAFAHAELGAGPLGYPRQLTAPPAGPDNPAALPALFVPPDATVRWTLSLAPAEVLRFRYQVVRESDAATAEGEEGFSLRLRRREAGAPPGPWLSGARRVVPLRSVQSGLLRAETLHGTLGLTVPEAGTWEVELRGEGPAQRTGVWSAFAELKQVRRIEVPRKHRGDGGRNVVLVVADTLRADHLGLYGYERPTSPVLDAAAAEGVVFDDCMPAAPHTLPSTATIMTGVLPRRHGVFPYPDGDQQLAPGMTTLAETARSGGYSTAGFVANCILPAGSGFDQGFEQYKVACGLRADRLTRLALRWLKNHRDERFFLYLHYMDPHSPYAAPEPFYSMFDPDYVGEVDHNSWDGRFWRSRVLVATVNGGYPVTLRPELGEEARFEAGPRVGIGSAFMSRLVNLYDGEIRYWDDRVAPVFAALRELGLWDETVIAVVADHGEEFGEEGHIAHGDDLSQAVLHVPFVLLGAGIGAPRRIPDTVSLADVAPTVLDLAGLPPPPGMDGRPLLGSGPPPAAPVFAWTRDYWTDGPRKVGRYQDAILGRTPSLDVVHLLRDDRWFTRSREPGQSLMPVPADSVPAELRKALLDLGPILPRDGATEGAPPSPPTAGELDVLRALGYLR